MMEAVGALIAAFILLALIAGCLVLLAKA